MQNPKKHGRCATCGRKSPLTKHHLIPRKRHKYAKKHFGGKGISEVIEICRTCHDGIHDLYDERTLAENFDTLEKLLYDERLQKHFRWVSKLKKVK